MHIIRNVASSRWVSACGVAALLATGSLGRAQQPSPTWVPQIRHSSGQNIVPVFEGWERNSDGTFNLVFGYHNRNFSEDLAVPVGPANQLEPGPADRGQPTYFYPQLNRSVFQVRVPPDFGKQELVWTLTVHGSTQKAYATLLPDLEIEDVKDPGRQARELSRCEDCLTNKPVKNQPPTVTVEASPPSIALADRLTLRLRVTDDGQPPPRPPDRIPANRGQDGFPTLHKGERGPVNVPVWPPMPRPDRGGLSVGWVLHRGPAAVAFEPEGYQRLTDRTGGTTLTTVSFSRPGVYVLRNTASDGLAEAAPHDVTVTVLAPASK